MKNELLVALAFMAFAFGVYFWRKRMTVKNMMLTAAGTLRDRAVSWFTYPGLSLGTVGYTEDIVYGAGKFLILTNSSSGCRLYTKGVVSTPGNFTTVIGSFTGSVCGTWAGDRFAVVMRSGLTARLYVSFDGLTWTDNGIVSGSFSTSGCMAWGAQKIAVFDSFSNNCYTTIDYGANWVTSAATTTPEKLCWTGRQFVGVAPGGACTTSPDGITWTSRPSLVTAMASNFARGVCASDRMIVACGEGGRICYSTDGITWTNAASATPIFTTAGAAVAVCWTGTRFVATGWNGKCATSFDGITWTANATLAPVHGTTISYAAIASSPDETVTSSDNNTGPTYAAVSAG